MKKRCTIPLLLLLTLAGCVTAPWIIEIRTDPAMFENENFRISYRIGQKIFFIKIENKTDNEAIIDYSRCSLVTVFGQAFALAPKATDNHLPARSSVILSTSLSTFVYVNIDNVSMQTPNDGPFYGSIYSNNTDDISFYQQYVGKDLRLIIPIAIGNTQESLDIKLRIREIVRQ